MIEEMLSAKGTTDENTSPNPQIWIAVVVIVRPVAWPRMEAVGDDHSDFIGRHLGERPVAIVSIQAVILPTPVGHKQVDKTVAVIIRPSGLQPIAALAN